MNTPNRPKPAAKLAQRFEQVAELLASIDIDTIWQDADDRERRILVEDLVDSIYIYADHLQGVACGAPPLRVNLDDVGLRPAGMGLVVSEGRAQPQVHTTRGSRGSTSNRRLIARRSRWCASEFVPAPDSGSGFEQNPAIIEHSGDFDLATELTDDRTKHLEREADLTVLDLRHPRLRLSDHLREFDLGDPERLPKLREPVGRDLPLGALLGLVDTTRPFRVASSGISKVTEVLACHQSSPSWRSSSRWAS